MYPILSLTVLLILI
jgi:CTD small phosphatase-like protein 2